jgi:hypothetical protein
MVKTIYRVYIHFELERYDSEAIEEIFVKCQPIIGEYQTIHAETDSYTPSISIELRSERQADILNTELIELIESLGGEIQ